MHTSCITSELRRITSALTRRHETKEFHWQLSKSYLQLLRLIQLTVPWVTTYFCDSEHWEYRITMKHSSATSKFLLSRSGDLVKAGTTLPFLSSEVFVFCSPTKNIWELSLQQILNLNTITKQPFTRWTLYTWWRITELDYTHGILEGEKNHKYTQLYKKNLWRHS